VRPAGSVPTRTPGRCRGYGCAAVFLAGFAAGCVALSGCSGPRSGISVRSSVDACAAALPVARAAVHQRGALVRVHALRRGELRELAGEMGLPPPATHTASGSAAPSSPTPSSPTGTASSAALSGTSLPAEPEPRACLVVFRGKYRARTVDHPIGAPTGRYAIALVRLHKARLVVVVVADRLPESLRT
jgi:hypothetical protein